MDIMDILIKLNGVLIMAVTSYIAWFIANTINTEYIKESVKRGYKRINDSYNDRRLQRQVKRYTKTISVKMSFVDKIELILIDKSNIRKYIPFMNFYVLVLFSSILFVISYMLVYKFLRFSVSSFILSSIAFFAPFILLEIMGVYNSEYTRRKLGYFISILRQWIDDKEDIIYAFEKSVPALVEPMKSYIRDLTIQVRRGMDPQDALTLLQMKVGNPQFTDFILNIKQNIKYRGDLKVLLSNMEEQFYKLEQEFNRRKISTFWDRIYIVLAMIFVIVVAYMLIKSTPEVLNFYTNTTPGKLLLTFFTMLYSAGFYILITISRFKH